MECLDEAAALAILDEGVDPAGLAEMSVHLDSCGYCRALVAAIGSADGDAVADATALTSLEPGTRIGKFVVEREVGAGASGAVYAVRDPELDRLVALKLLHYRGDAHSPAHEELLVREARAMAKLAHPNLVPVYEVGRWEGSVFVAMELVSGGTLRDYLASGERDRVLELMLGAGEGLAAAHDAGLVHRDFKPENILVGTDGRARVSDFGLALAPTNLTPTASSASPLVTQLGALVGTPAYMAPEQLRAQLADARSDQFAFSVVLYEALFGARPFTGATLGELEAAIQRPLVRAAAPRHVWRALRRGLAADPHARFASMHELLAALAPRSRRPLTFAAAGGIVVAAGVALAMAARSGEAPCAPIDPGVWTAATSAHVRAALDATHSPLAAATYPRIAAALDRYSAAWSAMHTEACIATRVHHDASDAMLDRRTACLADRKAEVMALVDALEAPTAATVEQAPAAIAALIAPGACANPDAEADPVQGAQATALRADLHREIGEATLDVTGATVPYLAQIADRARELKMPRLRAEALFQRGLAEMAARADEAATADFDEAQLTAEATKLDSLAARASSVAITAATDAGNLDAAKRYVRTAEAAVARLGASTTDNAELAARRAWYELHAGDAAKAEADARDAATHGCPELRTAACAHDDVLGTVLFSEGKYEAALATFRDNVALIEQDYGPDHPKTARAIERVATTLDKLGKHADALTQFDRAQAIVGDAATGFAAQIADNSGTALMALGKDKDAEARFRRSLAIREQLQGPAHPEVATTLVNLANVLDKEQRGDEAIALRERALKIFEAKLPPDHPLIAATLTSIGWHYVATKHPETALPYLERAATIQADRLGRDHPDYAYTLAVLGSAQLDAHRVADAALTLQQAIDCKGTNANALPDLQFNLADALWQSHGDRGKARALVSAADLAHPDPEFKRWLATHRE